jgi:hypothetical protein
VEEWRLLITKEHEAKKARKVARKKMKDQGRVSFIISVKLFINYEIRDNKRCEN